LHDDLLSLLCTGRRHRFPSRADSLDPDSRCAQCGKQDAVKPGGLFGEEAPMYAKLGLVTEEMRPQDILVVVGTSLVVATPQTFVPFIRYAQTGRNVLIDPNPHCTELFGLVEVATATARLATISETVPLIVTQTFAQNSPRRQVSIADDPRRNHALTRKVCSATAPGCAS
jgi:NAD-dependent deacetylase